MTRNIDQTIIDVIRTGLKANRGEGLDFNSIHTRLEIRRSAVSASYLRERLRIIAEKRYIIRQTERREGRYQFYLYLLPTEPISIT